MAMKSKTIQFVKASGLDQRWKGAVGYADQVVNMRVDPRGLGWVADRGVESWWKFPNPFSIVGNATTITEQLALPTEASFIWEKSSTGQIYYLRKSRKPSLCLGKQKPRKFIRWKLLLQRPCNIRH